MRLLQRIIGVVFVASLLTFNLGFTLLKAPKALADPTITEYSVPYGAGEITTGPDGALWYISGYGTIGRISTSGATTNYSFPGGLNGRSITTGSDGAIWFTVGAVNSASAGLIGRITTTGSVTEYPLPIPQNPNYITAGPDGALWFTASNGTTNAGIVGRISTSGSITEYPYPSVEPELDGITAGSDGALWIAENAGNSQSTGPAIGRITTTGSITRYPIPYIPSTYPGPMSITNGPDGNLWFTEDGADEIGIMTTSGVVTRQFVPQSSGQVWDITSGPDNALWFTDYGNGKIGRVTTSGQTTEYALPSGASSRPFGITSGPDGAVWFTEAGLKIGRITTPVQAPSSPSNLTAASPVQNPTLVWSEVANSGSYNIYRNGTKIDSTTNTTYTDNTALEGTNTYYVTAVNSAGESPPSNTVNVLVDRTAPTVSALSWSANPLERGQNTTLLATVTDALSGVSQVEYSINGGTPQPMTYDPISGDWLVTFGSDLAANTYNVTVYATDQAGNTSAGTNDILAVYTTANGYVTGHAKMQPTASDTMPIDLDSSKNPADLVLGFTNVTAPMSGSFDMDYSIKNNQNEFSLSSDSIDWVVVQDSSHASILGQADMTTYVNGVKTVTQDMSVRFDIALGANGSPDQVSIKLFNPGVDPNTGSPAYVINEADINGSNLMIHP